MPDVADLPTLAGSRLLRLCAFGGLYAAQGIPWGMFIVALPTWLASQGYSSAEVGSFIAAVSLPWTLKLLSGPLMDRFSYLPMGRRRPWVLIAQGGMLIGFSVMGLGGLDFYWLLGAGFFVNLCAAVQDVAVDGMAIDVLQEDERARANAFMYGGQICGISISSAGTAWLLANVGLGAASLACAIAVAAIALIPLLLRERPGEKVLPWTEGGALARSEALQQTKWRRIFGDLVKVIILPMSLVLIVVKFGDRVVAGILAGAFPVITTQALGFSETFYPTWNAAGGLVAAVFGVAVSPLIDRITVQRALIWGLLFKASSFVVAALVMDYWSNAAVMVAVIFVYLLVGQWITIASIALFMNLCTPRVAASQFAIYMALSNLALSAGSALLGPLDVLFEYDELIFAVAGIDIAMVCCMLAFNLPRHRLRLEQLFPTVRPERSRRT